MEANKKLIWTLLIIAGIVFLARLLSLPFDILYDTTDARYAEIGRIMAETGDWLTPYISGTAPIQIQGTLAHMYPFWAKPPLSFWATAASIKVFGINEFGAKLPHFLFLLASVALAWAFVRRYAGKLAAAALVAILATTTMFVFYMGGVMTDPALVFCLTLAMLSFYNSINRANIKNKQVAPKRSEGGWGYLFFIALGLGLLAKGPLMLVLVGLPIFAYVLIKKKWRDLFHNLPIISGLLLMLVIAAPWYIMAERATPGFLNYFFIGEHWERYLTPNWAGDMYGAGRGGFFGKIWLFWLMMIAPWSIYFAVKMFWKKFRTQIRETNFFGNEFLFYNLCFAIAPLVFFTMSKNILITYALVSSIPTAILLAAVIPLDTRKFKWFAGFNVFAIIIFCAIPGLKPSEKSDIIAAQGANIYYYRVDPPYSASFYSDGRAVRIDALSVAHSGDVVFQKTGRNAYQKMEIK